MTLQKITRADLDTAAPGLYQIDEPPIFLDDAYDIVNACTVSGFAQMVAAVRTPTDPPVRGLETRTRPDGCLIVFGQLILDPQLETK